MKLCGLVLVACVAGALAVPVSQSPKKCARSCSGVSTKFNYQTGKSYQYRYESETKIQVAGSSSTVTNVGLRADVLISSLSSCEFVLQLTGAQFTGAESESDPQMTIELEKSPLRFSFDDGMIRDVCPSADEPSWATNIKRGILSTFQNALEGSDDEKAEIMESDVSGRCPTVYDAKDESGSKVYYKTKDLVGCSEHRARNSALRGSDYASQSAVRNMPLVESKQKCRHLLSRKILTEATCSESHVFKPFKQDASGGVSSSTNQKLHFIKEKTADSIPLDTIAERRSLQFDHSEIENIDSADAQSLATDNLRQLCQTSDEDVRPETPGLFTDFVYNLRKINEQQLNDIQQEAKSNALCSRQNQFFMDALPMIGSDASIKIMATMLQDGDQLSDAERQLWTTSLAFVPKVTKAMLANVVPLLDEATGKELLGYSSFIHTFIQQNPQQADADEVQQAIGKLQRKIGNSCQAKDIKATEKMVLTLKAIGNIGTAESLVDALSRCFRQPANSAEIRVNAIKALRRVPCEGQKEQLLPIYQDDREEAEVRITAFVQLMRCPAQEAIQQIKEQQEQEPSNQVASFVWSYAKQVMQSSDPCKQELKELLSSMRFSKKVDKDPRKFSKYYEVSSFWDRLNVGANAEGAVIYSPDSFVPRQAFVNLTVDLFGTTFNLLEVGGRMEGVDLTLEKLFGPNGFYSNQVNYYFKKQAEMPTHENPSIQKMQETYGRKRAQDKLAVSMYMKVFGDDLLYYSVRDRNVAEELEDGIDLMGMLRSLAEHKEVNIKRNMLFMDSQLVIPTITGFPVRLSVTGTTSVNLDVSGHVDVHKIIRGEANANIQGTIKPSAAVRIAGRMSVLSGRSQNGVELVAQLHTATNMDALIQLKNGQVFNARFNLPKDKVEVLDVQSQLFTIKNNKRSSERGIVQNRFDGKLCSLNTIGKVTGLQLCAELSYPNASMVAEAPYFLLTGPAKFAIFVEKADPTLQTYEINGELKSSNGVKKAKITFNTPGSSVDREIVGDIQYGPGRKLDIQLKSPVKNFNLQGNFEQTAQRTDARLKATIDDSKIYQINGNVEKQHMAENIQRYVINGEVSTPSMENKKLQGTVEYRPLNHLKVDLSLDKVQGKTIIAKANYEYNKQQGKINSGFHIELPACHLKSDLDLKFYHDCNKAKCSIVKKAFVEYKDPRQAGDASRVTCNQQLNWDVSEQQTTVGVTNNVEFSKYPTMNLLAKYKLMKTHERIEQDLEVSRGKDTSEQNRLTITHVSQKTGQDWHEHNHELALKYPAKRWDYSGKAIYENRYPAHFKTAVEVDVDRQRKIDAEVSLKNVDAQRYQMTAEAKLKYPGRDLRIFKEVKERSAGEYQSIAIAQWGEGNDNQLKVNSEMKIKSPASGSYDYEVTTELQIPQVEQIVIHKRVKFTPTETRIGAKSKQGQTVLYDVVFDLVKESETTSKLSTRVIAGQLDYSLDLNDERQEERRETDFSIKRKQKLWAKGELSMPTSFTPADNEKLIRSNFDWDLDLSDQAKNALLQTTYSKTTESRKYNVLAKFKAPELEYKLESTTEKSDYYKTNLTISRNDEQILDFDMGNYIQGPRYSPRELTTDFKLMTSEPFRPYHVSGLFSYMHQGMRFHSHGHLTNHLNDATYAYQLKSDNEFNTRLLTSKNVAKIQCPQGALELHSTTHWQKDGQKRFQAELKRHREDALCNLDVHWTQPGEGQLEGALKLETGLERLRKLTAKVTTTQDDENLERLLEVQVNNAKKYRGSLKGTYGWENTDLAASIETPYARMEKVEATLVKKSNKFEMTAAAGDQNKFKLSKEFQVNDNARVLKAQLQAKIEGKLDYDVKVAGQQSDDANVYDVTGEAQIDGAAYKVTGKYDRQQPKITLKLQSPSAPHRALEVVCQRGQDVVCAAKIQKDSQSIGAAEISYRWQQNDRRAKIAVKNVPRPFSITLQGTSEEGYQLWRSDRVELVYEVVGNLNSPVDSTFALRLKKSPTEVQARIQYPKRTLFLHQKIENQLPTSMRTVTEMSLNEKDPSKTTKVELSYTHRQQGIYVTETIVNAPCFQHQIKLQTTLQKNGRCDDSHCKMDVSAKLQYASDSQKDVTAKAKVAYEKAKMCDTSVEITQPASKLNLKLFKKFQQEQQRFETGIAFKNSQGQDKQYAITAQNVDSGLKIQIHAGSNQYSLTTEQGQQPNEYTATILRNDQPAYTLSAKVDSDSKAASIEIKDITSGETLLKTNARIKNGNTISANAWHSENGQRIDDFEVSLQADDRNIVRTTTFIRPELREQLTPSHRRFIGSENVNNAKTNALQSMNELIDALVQPEQKIVQELANIVRPCLRQQSNEFSTIGQEMQQYVTETKAYYNSNAGQIYTYFAEMTAQISQDISDTLDDIQEYLALDQLQQKYEDVKQYLRDLAEEWPQSVRQAIETVYDAYLSFLQTATIIVQAITRQVTKLYEQLQLDELRQTVERALNGLKRSQAFKQVRQYFRDLPQSMPEINWQKIKDALNDYIDDINDKIQQWKDEASQWLDQTYASLFEIEELRPYLQAIKETIEKIKWSINYYAPQQSIRSYIDWLLRELAKLDITKPESLKRLLPAAKVSDPENGKYEWETKLPFKISYLQDLLSSLNLNLRSIKQTVSDWHEDLKKSNYDPSEIIDSGMQALKPSLSHPLSSSPPYDSVAFLVGDQHFVTFDQKTYDFASDCSFLLARDFQDGQFTITVQYEKRDGRVRRRSVGIQLRETNVEIFHDSKVLIGGSEVQLPQYRESDDVSISRANHKVTLQTAAGLKVQCDTYYHNCIVQLPRWSHGESAGMLGVNDNEDSNDMTLPDGSPVNQPTNFANGWKTSTSCAVTKNEAETQTIAEGHKMNKLCKQHFQSKSSPFKTCFREVQPEPYLAMCLTDMYIHTNRHEEAKHEQGICNVSAAYISSCEYKGIDLAVPTQCVKCNDMPGNQQASVDETVEIQGAQVPQSADVVFVVDFADQQPTEQIVQLAEAIEQKLQQRGLQGPRFGLIGFGGQNVHNEPHFHTGKGRLNFDVEGLRQALTSSQMPTEATGSNIDPMEAVYFMARSYPFRAGVKKIALLLKASSCDRNSADYYDVQAKLLERGITLHMIGEEDIEFRDDDHQEVIGINARSIYTDADVAAVEAQPEVRKLVVSPHDSCSILAQETNGTVFELSAFKKSPAKFNKVLAERISENARPAEKQVCECQSYKGTPRSVCFPKSVPRPMSLESGDSFFNIHYIKPLKTLHKKVKQAAANFDLFL